MTPSAPASPPAEKVSAVKLAIYATVIIATPLLLAVLLFVWLDQSSFASVDEIATDQLESLRMQLLNLPDGRSDVGPVNLDRRDFDRVLEPLRRAEPVDKIPATAWLGEVQVRYADGRRGTIKLRWLKRTPVDVAEAAAGLTGGATLTAATPQPRAIDPSDVWVQIGPHRYRGGRLSELIAVAADAAPRGSKP